MPFFDVRRRWFAISRERPVEGELSVEKRVERLAKEFCVTPAAMRVQLQQMKLHPIMMMKGSDMTKLPRGERAKEHAPRARSTLTLGVS